jgi:hypothetical protein
MPFGLTNASATFQSLMNGVLRPFLCWFVLVFFDDILIYNRSWTEHLLHVRLVVAKLLESKFFVKRTKCEFGQSEIAYLGHVISGVGVTMDCRKMQAVLDWPPPRSVKAVHAFLGLARYY